MYCARPSTMIPWSLTSGAISLSTRIAIPALILCDLPMGIPSFQKEAPLQNFIPLLEFWNPSFPRWCSWVRRIWGGGVESEPNQALISLGLGESPLRPLTLREAIVRGFSIIWKPVPGGWLADRSLGPFIINKRQFVLFLGLLLFDLEGGVIDRPRREEQREECLDIKLDKFFLPCRLR